ncbi:CheF family chemotaxis protein [Natronomonas salsuginis]|uniref:Response regulator n=1 Tax=Natronomonas salsuginis TaxID=2217661 RepID=A0A4U5J732_9EURY|nr:CheF family chemotaxis protein [Natronomonas salsuginis]TKR24444.1 response regulator [Natronomonas salsuginis]
MPTRVVCDFTADVTLDGVGSDDPRTMRVLVGDDRIVLGADDVKRTIDLDDVFDVVRDVSRGATPNADETVSIAIRTGEATEVASISARADELVRFQGALYRQALGGTLCVIEHESGDDAVDLPTHRFRLGVTASRIRFVDKNDPETELTIARDRILEFRALSGTDDDRRPAVLLVSDGDDGLAKTVVRLPSSRHLNLFGRYLKSELRLSGSPTDSHERSESIDLLLVDDDPQDLHAAEMFLKRRPEPFSIEMAAGGEAGLEHLETDDAIDCVVSDFRMPGMDGIEFLRAVRDRHPKLPFILYTGKGSEEVAKRAILDDVTDYVEKDVGTDQYDVLAERIDKAIRQPTGRRR